MTAGYKCHIQTLRLCWKDDLNCNAHNTEMRPQHKHTLVDFIVVNYMHIVGIFPINAQRGMKSSSNMLIDVSSY